MSGRSCSGLSLRQGNLPGVDPDRPSERGFVALLEAFRPTGGTAPSEVVGRLLEDYRVGDALGLARLVDTGQLFGFEWRGSFWIPMFQFEAHDLTVKTGPWRVRAELPPQWSGWTLASWFARANARLDGRSPADQVDSDPVAVMQAARSRERFEPFVLPRGRWVQDVAARL